MIQAMIIILAVTLPVVAALRAMLGKRVQALMRRNSPNKSPETQPGSEKHEVDATTVPQLIRLDASSITTEGDEKRYAQTRQSLSLFRHWWAYDAVSVIGVLVLWQLFYLSAGGEFNNISGINWLGFTFLIAISLRYFIYAGLYKDKAIGGAQAQGWFRRWILVAPEQLFRIFIHPRYSPYLIFFVGYAIYVSANTFSNWQFWLFLLILAPTLLRLHLYRLAQATPNRRLLILRVFGRDKSSALTFGAIRRYWQQIGSTFTVVDPSYLRYKYRGHSENHVMVAFFSCLFWAMIFGTPEFNDWYGIAGVLSILIILGYSIALIVMYLRAPRSFASSTPHIQNRLQEFLQHSRRLDLSFKDLDMYCYDNTWRDAVYAFVKSADVVLMDLRGYSEQNRGCETEIDYLFDSISVNRIVFLVNSDNDMQLIEKLVISLWRELSTDSPNLAISQPAITFYEIADQRAQDVRGLINTLVASTP